MTGRGRPITGRGMTGKGRPITGRGMTGKGMTGRGMMTGRGRVNL